MLNFDAARAQLIAAAQPIERYITLELDHCLNRVLAEDIVALNDSPPSDVSTLDGYAIATRDIQLDSQGQSETRLHVTQRIVAGQTGHALKAGEAARIFTGAAMPAGADAIVAQESAHREGDHIHFSIRPAAFDDVRRQGADFKAGDTLLQNGTRLSPAHLGLAASSGLATLKLHDRLRVALLTSGDEVIPPGQALRPGCIYNANATLLYALLVQIGCDISHHEHLPDNFDTTRDTLARIAGECDVLLTSGGVSVGDEDHIKAAVDSLGRIDLWKVRMKPGKPLAFGFVAETPFIGLPGNPVSGFATFVLFARPFLLAQMGANTRALRPLRLPAAFTHTRLSDRREFARGRITSAQGVELYANQGPGILSSLCWADALVELPENTTIAQGDLVNVHLLAELLA
jgi:molybdopterin molybdotransferase